MKKTFWTIAIFYMLIAFEFFYMASPFAIYFYSVYRPGLNFLNEYPEAAWLTSFFLPHVVEETSSTIINLHNPVGGLLAILGFGAFCVGAGQVYYHKLARKGAVTGGIYDLIRHPQYVSLAICSFGLLLLWPRYIVLVIFIAMLFAYYFLAKVEEMECEEKFGQAYVDYKRRTNMFLPLSWPLQGKLPGLPESRFGQCMSIFGLYVLTVIVSMGVARGVQSLALESLYAFYSNGSAYLSVTKMDPDTLERLAEIALANEEVRGRLDEVGDSANARFLNYVLPIDRYVSEIPMNAVEGAGGHHFFSSPDHDKNSYKIIFTKADLRAERDSKGKKLFLDIVRRTPVVEVCLDLSQGKVTKIQQPSAIIKYENVPVSVY
jgi:protein-S-isoprenylcysteine O-methyltransferase Ste14